jgi:hypothetical protein
VPRAGVTAGQRYAVAPRADKWHADAEPLQKRARRGSRRDNDTVGFQRSRARRDADAAIGGGDVRDLDLLPHLDAVLREVAGEALGETLGPDVPVDDRAHAARKPSGQFWLDRARLLRAELDDLTREADRPEPAEEVCVRAKAPWSRRDEQES